MTLLYLAYSIKPRRTNSETQAYLKSNFIPAANSSTIAAFSAAYPDDITQGSPFDTGILNAPNPEFKRLAAIEGDLCFQAPRRFFLQNTASRQNTWSFCKLRCLVFEQ